MKPANLTEKQWQTLEFIRLYILTNRKSPTYEEIGLGFDIRPGAAFERVQHLAYKGYVRQGRGHREIKIL